MKEQFTISGYNITTDPQFQNERFGNAPELVKQMETLFFEAQDKKNKKVIDKLTNLIIQYPKSPQIKNYLSVAYNVQEKYDKAIEVNNWILAEHPDYLFGKLNQAHEYINKGEAHKVPEILGEGMEIKELYPDRDLFHLVEVTGFYKAVIQYYTAIDNLELAENRLEVMQKIAPEHPDTDIAETLLINLRMKNGMKFWEEENKNRITPVSAKPSPTSQTTIAPKFNHLEINYLYNFGVRIPHEKLKEIIALPRASLIEDLENMLIDAVKRFDYFGEMDWEEETNNFVLHAIFLLKEIKAEESLPKIISFLEYDDEFLEFWLGDHKTDTLWQCFYGLGFNNTASLKQLLLKPGIDTYVKTAVSEALCQMVLHHPEKRKEISTVFLDVFTTNLEANLEDNLIDSDFLGLAIGDTVDCELNELLPVIKQLFEKKYVSLGINGDFNDVEKEFAKTKTRDNKKDLYNIFELYDEVINCWAGYNEDDEDGTEFDDDYDFNYRPTIPIQAVSTKIGRNEPCPCGSGKKYKKCCIDKN